MKRRVFIRSKEGSSHIRDVPPNFPLQILLLILCYKYTENVGENKGHRLSVVCNCTGFPRVAGIKEFNFRCLYDQETTFPT